MVQQWPREVSYGRATGPLRGPLLRSGGRGTPSPPYMPGAPCTGMYLRLVLCNKCIGVFVGKERMAAWSHSIPPISRRGCWHIAAPRHARQGKARPLLVTRVLSSSLTKSLPKTLGKHRQFTQTVTKQSKLKILNMATDNLKTYRGNCHCTKFVYELKSPEIKEYFRCTCSICSKLGAAWLLADNDNVNFVKGSIDALAVYTFNEGNYKHMVCGLPCNS